ncbi:hypothetical protein KR026_005000 [Drosophila bipectinata]|nr:hypothetical protein KR026_005000 [Drosophila bipectinata]
MPKKPQHLSLSSTTSAGSSKPKYSLTLHNGKHGPGVGGGGKNPQAATLQQRQHVKALRLTREAAETPAYRLPAGLAQGAGRSPSEEAGAVHLKAANGEDSTKSNGNESTAGCRGENGSGGGMANGGVVRTQNKRLWYN